MTLSDSHRGRCLKQRRLAAMGLPCCLHHPSGVPCPLPRRIGWVLASIASPPVLPSPYRWRVGIRIFTFEACSGFTRVTARWIAQPPSAAFVTRLRSGQLPSQTARQLPDRSTSLWVESSSTGDTRLSGHTATSGTAAPGFPRCALQSGLQVSLSRHARQAGERHGELLLVVVLVDQLS